MSTVKKTAAKRQPQKPQYKAEGPKGLRVGRIVMYKDHRAKVSSIITNAKAKIILTDSGDEIAVERIMLTYPPKAKRTVVATKKAPVATVKPVVTIKKATVATVKPAVTTKKVKQVVAKEADKPPETKPKKEIGSDGTYNILRPDYVMVGFTNVEISSSSTLQKSLDDALNKLLAKLGDEHIELLFTRFGESSGVSTFDQNILNRMYSKEKAKHADLVHVIETLLTPEKSRMVMPVDDVFVFSFQHVRDLGALVNLLCTIKDVLGVKTINSMITLPDEEGSALHNILFINYRD